MLAPGLLGRQLDTALGGERISLATRLFPRSTHLPINGRFKLNGDGSLDFHSRGKRGAFERVGEFIGDGLGRTRVDQHLHTASFGDHAQCLSERIEQVLGDG